MLNSKVFFLKLREECEECKAFKEQNSKSPNVNRITILQIGKIL
jgi:hypothetical protein